MEFKQNKFLEKTGEFLGFLFSYALFTTILFYILSFMNKLPDERSFFYVVILTMTILAVGLLLKYLLK